MHSLILICILVTGASFAAAIKPLVPFPNVYKNITVEEHKTFIQYYLMKAYYQIYPHAAYILTAPNLDPEISLRMENVETPANFSLKLYSWTANHYNLSGAQMYRLARGDLICIPPEMVECVDPGDSGSICCT